MLGLLLEVFVFFKRCQLMSDCAEVPEGCSLLKQQLLLRRRLLQLLLVMVHLQGSNHVSSWALQLLFVLL